MSGFISRAITKMFPGAINSAAQKQSKVIVDQAVTKIKANLGYSYGHNYTGYGGMSAGAKYPFGLSASGRSRTINHYLMRRNARDKYIESAQGKALVDRFADTVADNGLRLEAVPNAELLGIAPEQIEAWSRNIEAKFDLWSRSKVQNRSECMTFYQAQRLYQIFQQRDNDNFTRLYYSKDKELLNPVQFEFMDPDQIRGDAMTSTIGIHNKQDGIIRDARGRETAYQVWIQTEDNKYEQITIKRLGPKSKRVFMLHGFTKEFAGQTRGYTRLSHAIQELENITDFSLAVIKRAINQSQIIGYVKPSENNPASDPLEGIMTNRGAGPAGNEFAPNSDSESAACDTTDANVCPVECHSVAEATMNVPGSMFVTTLNEGEEIKFMEQKTAGESFNTFVDSFTSYISAASGMPIEVLRMKFTESYSASRGALILFWRVVQIWRDEMSADFLNPIYKAWLSEEIAAGRVFAPGWSDPVLRAAWLNARWIGSPMPNIDPMKTAKADMLYTEMGAQDLDRLAKNFNGSDGPTNRTKLKRQFGELPPSPWQKQSNS